MTHNEYGPWPIRFLHSSRGPPSYSQDWKGSIVKVPFTGVYLFLVGVSTVQAVIYLFLCAAYASVCVGYVLSTRKHTRYLHSYRGEERTSKLLLVAAQYTYGSSSWPDQRHPVFQQGTLIALSFTWLPSLITQPKLPQEKREKRCGRRRDGHGREPLTWKGKNCSLYFKLGNEYLLDTVSYSESYRGNEKYTNTSRLSQSIKIRVVVTSGSCILQHMSQSNGRNGRYWGIFMQQFLSCV